MKTFFQRILPAAGAALLALSASAQMPPGDMPPDGEMMGPPEMAGQTETPAVAAVATSAVAAKAETPSLSAKTNSAPVVSAFATAMVFEPPVETTGTNSDGLRLNFRNAPLEMVLNYLSDAAGFIIVLDTQVRGTVSVISSHPMTKDEAVDLLNSVLNKNGYAAIRDGRTLTIVDKNEAKTRNIPVKTGNDPSTIPANDEIVTQIIPIRFVEARQLVSDLSGFVSPQATVIANEAGNAIVITDTQSNIRHLIQIIQAIDNSAEGETEIRVFQLKYASPVDVASELETIFPSSSSSSSSSANAQSPFRFGGPGMMGGFGGFAGRGGNSGSSSSSSSGNSRVQKQSQVTVVADSRTSSVIVTASKDLMEEITGMMAQLDMPSVRDQKVFVFHMNNGDPQQAATVLQNMFQSSTSTRGGSSSSSSSSSQNSALMVREQNNASTSSSTTSSSTSSSSGFGTSKSGSSSSSF